MKKNDHSQEDIFLELKLIAFRKKLEEQKVREQQISALGKDYEETKKMNLQNFQQNTKAIWT